MMGTRVGDEYEWVTYQDVAEEVDLLARCLVKLNLCPEIEAEGKKWRFLAIQSKNRKEWNIAHLANMHIGATTVALYDTLGEEGLKFIMNQTELTTIACSGDQVAKISQRKLDDSKLPESD